MSKKEIYNDVFLLFLNKKVPNAILEGYLDNSENSYLKLSDFIGLNMKRELLKWCTCVGIIESADHLYNCALENGNLKQNKNDK